MNRFLLLCLLISGLCTLGYAQAFKKLPTSKDNCKTAVKEGVLGKVLYYEGNMMPDPSQPNKERGKPVSRFIYIYERCKASTGNPYQEFFLDVEAKFVKKVASDANGCFKASLKPGHYSILVEEERKLYTNLFDQNNYINPIEVKAGKTTSHTLRITYKAFF